MELKKLKCQRNWIFICLILIDEQTWLKEVFQICRAKTSAKEKEVAIYIATS